MEELYVKNFGPIREATLDLRKLTAFIGPQASGKSVLAKLVGVCRDYRTVAFSHYTFLYKLVDLNILEFVKEGTKIIYTNDKYTFNFVAPYGFTSSYSGKAIQSEAKVYNEPPDIPDDLLNRDIIHPVLQQFVSQLKTLGNQIWAIRSERYKAIHEGKAALLLELDQQRDDLDQKILELEKDLTELAFVLFYIPAERALHPILSGLHPLAREQDKTLFEYISKEATLPNHVLPFSKLYESARGVYSRYDFEPAQLSYRFDGQQDLIVLPGEGNVLPLSQSASGFQSLLPMLLTISAITAHKIAIPPQFKQLNSTASAVNFLVEEPELNLYPATQRAVMEFLVEKCTSFRHNLVFTTHSPYLLMALNNLIQADNVAKAHPDNEQKLDELVPPSRRIAYEEVRVYEVKDGGVRLVMDDETRLIDSTILDEVTESILGTFEQLLDLKYPTPDAHTR